MAAGNTVTLTFAGDSTSLERSLGNVGAKATKMAGDFDKAEGKSRSFAGAMDNVGGAVGNSEGKFMGAADLLDGLGGAFGLPTEAATGLFRAFGDLSGGFEVVQGLFSSGITKIGEFASNLGIASMATKIWTGIQAAFNAVMALNPVILIGAAVVALGAALVIAYKKSETFRDVVDGAFSAVKGVVESVLGVFGKIGDVIGGAFTSGVAVAKTMINALIGLVETGLNVIMKPYHMASGFLNKIPGLGSAIPDFLTRDIHLPRLHTGGPVPGQPGSEVPIMALAGETVLPPGAAPGGGTTIIQLVLDGRVITEVVHQGLLRKQRTTPLGLAT